jgi:integrase
MVIGRVRMHRNANGTWRLRWTDDTGRAREQRARDDAQAMTRAAEINNAVSRPGAAWRADSRLADVVAAAIDPAGRPSWGPRHHERLTSLARCHLVAALGDRACNRLTPADWAGVLVRMQSEGYAGSTVKGVRDLMRLVVEWGKFAGVWDRWADPLFGVQLPKAVKASTPGRTEPIRPEEVPTVAACAALAAELDKQGNWGLAVRLAYRCGLRWGEILAVGGGASGRLFNRFDPVTRQLHIDWQWNESQRDGLTLTLPKHDKTRVVIVPADLADELAAATGPECGFLLVGPRGGIPRRSNAGRRILRPAMDCCGYPAELTLHSMRHRAAVDLVTLLTLPDASAQLGHHSPKFTLERYVGIDGEHLDRVRAATA